MGEDASYCERCWSVVPHAFDTHHEAWHASGGPWHQYFDERELERWSAGTEAAS